MAKSLFERALSFGGRVVEQAKSTSQSLVRSAQDKFIEAQDFVGRGVEIGIGTAEQVRINAGIFGSKFGAPVNPETGEQDPNYVPGSSSNRINSGDEDVSKAVDEAVNNVREDITDLLPKRATTDSEILAYSDNPLNEYVDVQYHISLSIVSEANARQVQRELAKVLIRGGEVNDLAQDLRNIGAVVIASTGEEFRDDVVGVLGYDLQRQPGRTLADQQVATRQAEALAVGGTISDTNLGYNVSKRNYYNIEEMTLENTMGPTMNNPYVANMIGITMKISEPMGFNLVDDIRNVADTLKYTELQSGRILYRIDVRFSGYDPVTGQWVNTIKMNTRGKNDINVLTYYCNATGFDAMVTHQGATYELKFAPSGTMAFRPEDFTLKGLSLTRAGWLTYGDFLDGLAQEFKVAKEKASRTVKGEQEFSLNRNIRFIAPDALRKASYPAGRYALNHLMQGSRVVSHYGDGQDILTVLRHSLSDLEHAQNVFINDEGNDNFVQPRIQYTVRLNTIYGDKIIQGVKDYEEITFEYIIEPFATYSKGSVDPDTLEKYISPEAQRERLKEMSRYGMLIKKYDYINVSENTELIEFELKFNHFYFRALNRDMDYKNQTQSVAKPPGRVSDDNNNNDTNETPERPFPNAVQNGRNPLGPEGRIGRTLRERQVNSKGATPASSGLNRFPGSFNLGPEVYSQSHDETEGAEGQGPKGPKLSKRKAKYLQEQYDMFRNDLLKLDGLRVRGDPIWMLSAYGNQVIDSSLPSPNLLDPQKAIINQGDKVIFLNMKPPALNDYLNPDRRSASTQPNMISGFYTVTKATSVFAGGKFTQNLEGFKIENLFYVEDSFFADEQVVQRFTQGVEQISPNGQPLVDSDLAQFGRGGEFGGNTIDVQVVQEVLRRNARGANITVQELLNWRNAPRPGTGNT